VTKKEKFSKNSKVNKKLKKKEDSRFFKGKKIHFKKKNSTIASD